MYRISIVALSFCGVFTASIAEAAYSQSSYYSQPSYYSQSSYGATFSAALTAGKDFTVLGHVSKGSGTFVIDHPLDPKNKLLYHSFVESPDAKDWYDGVVTLDTAGEARVELPRYFEALNMNFRYQLKPIGAPMPGLFIREGVKGNTFTIGGGIPGGRVSWQVTGTRKDPYILANPIVVEVKKGSNTLVKRGELVHESAYPSQPPSLRALVPWVKGIFGW